YAHAAEYTRDGGAVYSCALPQGSNAIRRHRNGNVLLAGDREVLEVDTSGRKVRSVPLPPHSLYTGVLDLPGDRVLVANSASGRIKTSRRDPFSLGRPGGTSRRPRRAGPPPTRA